MPIYTYRIKGTHTAFDVLQKDDQVHQYLEELDEDAIVPYPGEENPFEAWEGENEIERVPSAPGVLLGGPTPKFYGKNR